MAERTNTYSSEVYGGNIKRVNRIAALLLAAALASCAHNSAVPSGKWAMYQAFPSHNAVLPGALSARWKTDIGQRTNGGIAVAAGLVFVDTFGKEVLALDAHSGAVRWRAGVDNIVMSTPVVANGLVFIGTGMNELGNTQLWARNEGDSIVAFDVRSGTRRWTFKTRGEDMPSPVLVGGTLVFANGDAHAYGLNARTGSLIWSRRLPGIATMASANAVRTDAVLSVCTNRFTGGATARFEASTGAQKWMAPFGNCDSAPAFGGGLVYVSGIEGVVQSFGFGGRGYVAALRPETGKPLWIYRSGATGFDTTAGSAERVVAGTYYDGTYYQSIPGEDMMLAFDARTGALRWKLRTLGPVKMSPLAIRDRLLFGDGSGLFYTLNAQSGRILQVHTFREGFSSSPPVIAGNTIFMSNGRSVVAAPLAHYWGARLSRMPHLLDPSQLCLSGRNCPH